MAPDALPVEVVPEVVTFRGVAVVMLLPACAGRSGRKLLMTAMSFWLLLALGYWALSNCVTALKYAADHRNISYGQLGQS
jgi:hypothetical protein